MKKPLLALVLVLALFGCSDSGSSLSAGDIQKPPVIKDKLTFLENSTPYGAIIFNDEFPLDNRSTTFVYGVENLTNVAYNNVSFSIEPSDPTKYSLGSDCTSLAYGKGCFIFVHVNTKTTADINFSIKMNSDRGEQTFATTPIKAKYVVQPSVDALNIASGMSNIFVVSNSLYHSTRIKGEILFNADNQRVSLVPEYSFASGTAGFSIVTTNEQKTLPVDGVEQKIKNCFATGMSIPNAGINACYVEVLFNNPSTAPQSDTLSLTVKVRPGVDIVWKAATIALTSAN